MPNFGVYTRKKALQLPDQRTREARLLKQTRATLLAQLGGEDKVTPSQRALVERCAHLELRIAVLDAKVVDGTLTDHDSRAYLSWVNALGRALERLGLLRQTPAEPPAKPDPMANLRAYLAEKDKAA
jgi:hypothetical protein